MSDWQERYILKDVQTKAISFAECYAEAMKEILLPMPAIRLVDFPTFSQTTGGFREKEFTILCGQTGVGKTTLLANFSVQLLKQGVKHFVASVETGRTDYVKRMVSCLAGEDWNTGAPVNLDAAKAFHIAHARFMESQELQLSLYEDRFDVRVLMNDIADMVRQGVKIVFIDNLNFFLEVTSAQNSVVEMDRVIHELIIFCKQVPVHIVMVMHPKKTDGGRVESEFDIKGSSTAVQEAHNIFLFNRVTRQFVDEGIAKLNDREIKIAKMRRRGLAVGSRLILRQVNGVKYVEGAHVGFQAQ